jgi:hypothetical protein
MPTPCAPGPRSPCGIDLPIVTRILNVIDNRNQELRTPTGRPVQLFREGKIVEKLLS